jgi:hypothetical protein
MPEQQWIGFYTREVPIDQLAVGGITQTGHLVAHQSFIRTRHRARDFNQLNLTGLRNGYREHNIDSSIVL